MAPVTHGSGQSERAIFTRHQELVFPYIKPGTSYNLPFFWHSDIGDILFTDRTGQPLTFCKDSHYEAVNHQMVWIRYDGLLPEERVMLRDRSEWDRVGSPPAEGHVKVNLYFGRMNEDGYVPTAGHWLAEDVVKEHTISELKEVSPKKILFLAELFDEDTAVGAEWQSCLPSTSYSLVSTPRWHRSTGRCVALDNGKGLRFSPGKPSILSRPFHRQDFGDIFCLQKRNDHRLHLRAFFYDTAEGTGSQFVGITSKIGTGAVGIFADRNNQCKFGFVQTFGSFLPETCDWTPVAKERSKGWHVLELVLQKSLMLISIDDEPLKQVELQHELPASSAAPRVLSSWDFETKAAQTHPLPPGQVIGVASPNQEERVWIGASGSARAAWGAIELLHSPLGDSTWEVGVQDVQPGNRRPWRMLNQEKGTFEVDVAADVWTVTKTSSDEPDWEEERRRRREKQQLQQQALEREVVVAAQEEPEAESPTILVVEEPAEEPPPAEPELAEEVVEVPEPIEEAEPLKLPPGRPRAKGRTKSKTKPRTISPAPPPMQPWMGLVIDCWTVAGESDLQRLDRVMAFLLDNLVQAGVPMPSNIQRIDHCSQPEHDACYVYSFGTRRLHIATREGDAGRITLVVRIGGGFIDFLEFVKRNGTLEKLRFDRRPDSRGHQHVRLCSVMQNGRTEVRELPLANATGPDENRPRSAARQHTAPDVKLSPLLPSLS